jgi:hypothetical protein
MNCEHSDPWTLHAYPLDKEPILVCDYGGGSDYAVVRWCAQCGALWRGEDDHAGSWRTPEDRK